VRNRPNRRRAEEDGGGSSNAAELVRRHTWSDRIRDGALRQSRVVSRTTSVKDVSNCAFVRIPGTFARFLPVRTAISLPRVSRTAQYLYSAQNPWWINTSILVGAGCFIFALILSAVFDARIRVLHVLQALIYVVVIVLTRKSSAWGFGAGCIIAAFWKQLDGANIREVRLMAGCIKREKALSRARLWQLQHGSNAA